MTLLSSVSETDTISSGQYKISSKDELKKLAAMTNSGKITGGEFVLADDIDLENEEWTPIGTSSKQFKGTFDGNGHKITGLYINSPNADYQGLFGYTQRTIKNVGVEGSVTGKSYTGLLVGNANNPITNSYATGDVSGTSYVGGLAGYAVSITNSYATGNVSGTGAAGGLAGYATLSITNSYATGDVSGTSFVGGLVGTFYKSSGTANISNVYSLGTVSGNSSIGALIGSIIDTLNNGASFGIINITNAAVIPQDIDMIGFELNGAGVAWESGQMEGWLENITTVSRIDSPTALQVGIHGDDSSHVSFETSLSFDLSSILSDITADSAYTTINDFLSTLSSKATSLGAVSNRLESALESISVDIENLTSSRSTIKDADIAKVSSDYIRQQILQQAAATLLSTANQSPAIALQLI